MAALFTLPAGFPQVTELPPRVVDGKPRKALVLGYLPHRSSYVFVAEAASPFLPGIDVERFPAEGRKPSTPPAMLTLGKRKEATVGKVKQHLVVSFASTDQREMESDLLLVYLHDADKKLLDWRRIEILEEASDAKTLLDPKRPREEHTPLCTWAVEEKAGRLVASITCPRNPDPSSGLVTCKENPSWTLRWRVGAKGDKLDIQRKRIAFPGKECYEDGE